MQEPCKASGAMDLFFVSVETRDFDDTQKHSESPVRVWHQDQRAVIVIDGDFDLRENKQHFSINPFFFFGGG